MGRSKKVSIEGDEDSESMDTIEGKFVDIFEKAMEKFLEAQAQTNIANSKSKPPPINANMSFTICNLYNTKIVFPN